MHAAPTAIYWEKLILALCMIRHKRRLEISGGAVGLQGWGADYRGKSRHKRSEGCAKERREPLDDKIVCNQRVIKKIKKERGKNGYL